MKRLAPGETFGDRYLVVGMMGKGSMGAVYEVREETTGDRFALKIMHPELFDADPRAAYRFEREARLSAQLENDHIVRTLATGVDDESGTPWLAMEYLTGDTLKAFMEKRGALEGLELRRLVTELFSAVSTAHAAGIVHRDLKPDNVFLADVPDAEPTLKVLDFGIAKEMPSGSASVTATGLGTPLWAAPEQGFEGFKPMPTVDVWALGLLVFHMFTGKFYWLNANTGGSIAQLAMELLRSPIAPASQRALDIGSEGRIPTGFDEWFLRCVSRNVEGRFEDATRAFEVLEDLLPGD